VPAPLMMFASLSRRKVTAPIAPGKMLAGAGWRYRRQRP
jgi:hypothetical protein